MNKLQNILMSTLEVKCGQEDKLVGKEECIAKLTKLFDDFAEYIKNYEPTSTGTWYLRTNNTYDRCASEVSKEALIDNFLKG